MGGQKDRAKAYHTSVVVTDGLYRAIELRARAHGVTRAHYVKLWLADLVDGQLPWLHVVPVTRWQLYGDERAYVLPITPELPETRPEAPAGARV